jgi:beta-glucosidase
MNLFNDINLNLATGNKYLQRDIQSVEAKVSVVSDWVLLEKWSITDFQKNKEAALQAITAGSDMDMESNAYRCTI